MPLLALMLQMATLLDCFGATHGFVPPSASTASDSTVRLGTTAAVHLVTLFGAIARFGPPAATTAAGSTSLFGSTVPSLYPFVLFVLWLYMQYHPSSPASRHLLQTCPVCSL